jgi:hypothetical protein
VLVVSACDDNPLAEDRDQASHFRLNPSNVVVNTGGIVKVDANVLNRYGAATNAAVTATACDANITAAADTGRSDFEFPERFTITGVTFGNSCLVVNGGGLTDTIDVRVVPAAVDIELSSPGDTILESGDIVTLPVALLSEGGAAAPGVAVDDRTVLDSSDPAVGSVDQDGQFIARSPGSTYVRATFTDLGVTRRDSVLIVVIPAGFDGTATQAAYGGGQVIEFTAGGIPFDDNTRVEFAAGMLANDFVHILPNTATTIRAALTPGTEADSVINFRILNAGPNESTVEGSFTTTAAAPDTDPFLNNGFATARTMEFGEDMFGTIEGFRGAEEWFIVDVTEAGTYRISFEWADGEDKDAYVIDATSGATLVALENGAAVNPETAAVELEPGTYYLVGATWDPEAGGPPVYYRMRFTREE